jgi:hypothetical protein
MFMNCKVSRHNEVQQLDQKKPFLQAAETRLGIPLNPGFHRTKYSSDIMAYKTDWYSSVSELFEASGLRPENVFLQNEYLESLEQGGPSAAGYRYALVRNGKKAVAVVYVQLIPFSLNGVDEMIRDKPYRRLLKTVRALLGAYLFRNDSDRKSILLVCGNMCVSGDHGVFSTDRNALAKLLPGLLQDLTHALSEKYRVIAQIVKDFPEDDDPFGQVLKSRRFFRLDMDPVMKLRFPDEVYDIQAYCAALSSKYRVRYNQTLKKIVDCEWRDLSLAEMEKHRSEMQGLYSAVQDKAPLKIMDVDMDYLISLKRKMGKSVRCSALFEGQQMLAFTTGILNGEEFEAHHIGLDYGQNRHRALYLNVLFHYIEMALESGARTVCFGRTALEMKTTVGAVPVYFNAFMKLSNGFLNGFVRCLLPDPAPHNWIPRSPFRK